MTWLFVVAVAFAAVVAFFAFVAAVRAWVFVVAVAFVAVLAFVAFVAAVSGSSSVVEHLLAKQEAEGSSPFSRSNHRPGRADPWGSPLVLMDASPAEAA